MKRLLSMVLSCIIMLTCFSGISFVSVNAGITVFSQTDSRWGSHFYGYSNTACTQRATISSGGCGILAYVNAVYYLNGCFIEPTFLADYSVNNGHRVNGQGTAYSLYKAFANSYGSTYGISYAGSTSSYSTLASHLNAGGVAIGSAPGHLMAVVDYDGSTGKYLILDSYKSSNRYTYSTGYTWQTKSVIESTAKLNFSHFELINNIISTPPTNVTLTKNQNWYDIKDTITLYPNSNGATSYWLSVYKGDAHIVDTAITGEYSFSASTWGQGDYYAWITATNSSGSTDSQGINFSVVGAPGYSNVYASNWWYDLSDTVSITVAPVCSKGQVIGIDKNGTERVITQECDTTFTIPASKLGVGEYSAYFSVYNGSGGIDTERVTFGIVDKPKDGAVVTSSKSSYILDDVVEVSVLAYCAKGQVIGIDKNGVERVVTEDCGTTYTIPASQLGCGKYTAYFSIYNGSGGYDTERVEFAIDNPLTNPQISINKKDFDIKDEIIIKASADGGVDEYTLKIYDTNGNKLNEYIFIGHEIIFNATDLGVGTYTAEVKCSNYAFDVKTDKISFNVTDQTECIWGNGVVTKNPTCISIGTKLYTCVDCGKTKTETIPITGHTEIVTKGYGATCKKDGLTDEVHCSVCKQVLTEQKVIPAKGHTPDDEWTTISSSSCTGKDTQVKYCLECGEIVEIKEVSSKGHTVVIDEAVEATCLNSGLTEGSHCSVCQLVLVAQQVVAPSGHQWDDGYVSKSATCTAMGEKTHTCTNCGETKTSIIPVLGHNFDDEYTVDAEATCTTDGSQSKHCTNCDAKAEITVIKATGHTHIKEVTTPANCATEGIATYTCYCGDSYTEAIKKLAHNIATDSKDATYFEEGYADKEVCQDCGEVIADGTVVHKLTLAKPKVTVTGGKKKITVRYTKVTDATGFEVKCKIGKKIVAKTFKAKKNVTRYIKKLTKGTYRVQVRAYVKQGNNTAYSSWTKANKVKVK